jgi:hypothetical protein
MLLVASAFLVSGIVTANAEEETHIITSSGEWAAMSHSPSQLAPADTCMAVTIAGNSVFMLRIDEETKEIRVVNKKWTLPSGVTGSFNVTIGSYHKSFDIEHNTDVMVTTEVDSDGLVEFINAMDKGSTITVSAGKSAPMAFTLSGSTRVTNALKVCAGIHEASKPGANPFE